MPVEFRLFGRVEARLDGRPIDIGYARLRSVLAVLLVDINHAVAVDQIVDRVWGDRRLPQHPRGAVQHSIALLRASLAPDVTISWQANGYLLAGDPDTVDLHRFQHLIAQARITTDDEHASSLLEQATRLWHGEPFSGLDTPWLSACRATVTQQHHAARLDLADIHLRQGEHAALVPELSERATQHPLDERLAGQLMLALYRSGRPAHALSHYQQLRRSLADELGTDPSPPLRQLHQQMLTTDPALTIAGRDSRAPLPRQLPAPPRMFTGRDRELGLLTAALREEGGAAPLVVIGAGGMGKTWLALHWAYQNLDLFPDGQLYVNLRGFDPRGTPMSPAMAIRGFLDALGVTPESVPRDPDAQVGLYRSLVATKRMLIVLDNARDAEHVISLLPGGSACTTLVTSRHRLDGVATTHGATQVALDVLTDAEARQLLTRHLGRDRLDADPEAASEILTYCAGLPLAVSVVAARASHHPRFPLAALATELRDRTGRLSALETADTHVSLRAALSCSHQALSRPAADAFALLGLAPGADISVPATTSLLALTTTSALTVLRELEHAHLVQQHRPGRFRMHDLVRLYASQQDLSEPARTTALRRLVDFYLHTAHTGDRLLQPLLSPIELAEPVAGCRPYPLDGQRTALAWFTAELPNLMAIQDLATTQGWAASGWQLAWLLTTYLYRQGRFHAALAAWQTGQAAVDSRSEPAVRTGTHQILGAIFAELGEHQTALHHLTEAERSGDVTAQAYTHHALGWSWSLHGDNHQAIDHATRSLRLYRSIGVAAGETRELTVLGWYHARLGDFAEASTFGNAALTLARQHGYREDEAFSVGILGVVAQHTGQPRQAADLYRRSRTMLNEVGNTYYEATVLDFLGETELSMDSSSAARDAFQQAFVLYQAQGRADDADRVQRQLEKIDQTAPVMPAHAGGPRTRT
jgi:DNA-binding SARP family transcriptional activator/tetratricopeptide (TPR) repeat protein